MPAPAGCRYGRTALTCPTSASHNTRTRLQVNRQPPRANARRQQNLPTANRSISFINLVLLFICVFSRYGASSALVGRSRTIGSRQAEIPSTLLVDETPLVNFGNDSPTETGYMDLNKRQGIVSDLSTASSSSFPEPFDGGLGNNFTASSCSLFFQNFLNDPKYQQCHAVSLLLVVCTDVAFT